MFCTGAEAASDVKIISVMKRYVVIMVNRPERKEGHRDGRARIWENLREE